jgi:hypothetical protein
MPDQIKITLSPANSPTKPGEPARVYSHRPAIKDPELGTFWPCDQCKLFDTMELNREHWDKFSIRKSGSRTSFYLANTLIWSTTKPIGILAEKMALEMINKSDGAHSPLAKNNPNKTYSQPILDTVILNDCIRNICMGPETLKTDANKAKIRACYKSVTGNTIPDNVDPFDYAE